MEPLPPIGRHHCIARLYALDTVLTLNSGVLRRDVEFAMEGHVLEKAAFMGNYLEASCCLNHYEGVRSRGRSRIPPTADGNKIYIGRLDEVVLSAVCRPVVVF